MSVLPRYERRIQAAFKRALSVHQFPAARSGGQVSDRSAALILVPDLYGEGANERTVGLVGESSRELAQFVRASGDQLELDVETRAFADESAGRAALRSDDVSVLIVDRQRLVWKAKIDDQLNAS